MLNKYTTSMCTNRLWSPNPPYTIKCEEGKVSNILPFSNLG